MYTILRRSLIVSIFDILQLNTDLVYAVFRFERTSHKMQIRIGIIRKV
jgi:hypothetical protein